ncbi:MAG: Ig-like domain-containing protein [Mycobacterium kyogaense]|uniref:Ig-like domain-containing protein n=1 Tax=Mycobacterium kyogaense TaxID=2212479 RepID=UPI002FFA44D7
MEPTTLWAWLSMAGREVQRNRKPDLTPFRVIHVKVDEVGDASDPLVFGATDKEGDTLSYWSAKKFLGPRHGTVTIDQATGTFTYTPTAQFALTGGKDRFLVRVGDREDGDLTTFAGWLRAAVHRDYELVTVVVEPTVQKPVAKDDNYVGSEDDVVTGNVLANDSDPDTPAKDLKAALGEGPAHGTITLNSDGTFVYTPTTDFNGTDSFTYTVSDGVETVTATASITIRAVNDAPTATDSNFGISEDGTLEAGLKGADRDGDPLTYTVGTEPKHGSVVVTGDRFTYTPTKDYNGTDSFTYVVTDAAGAAVTATVTLTVGAVNDAPVAGNDSYTVDEDDTLTVGAGGGVLANDSDTESDPLTPVVATDPRHGSVTMNTDGSFVYKPNADFNGTDSFTYTVGDSAGGTATGTVVITVKPVNDAPVVGTPTVGQPNAVTGQITGSLQFEDSEGDRPVFGTSGTSAKGGTVTVDPLTGAFVYKPGAAARHDAAADNATDADKTDTFDITVDDGKGGITTVSVTVAIVGQNASPTGTVSVGQPNSSGAVGGAITVADSDQDAAVFTASASNKGGTIVIDSATGEFTYVASAAARHAAAADGASDADKTDTFTVTVDDGHGGVTTLSVTVDIAPANAAPTGSSVSGTPNPTTGVVAGTVTVTDGDNDAPRFSVSGMSDKGGTVTINALTGQFTYQAGTSARHAAAADGASDADKTDTFTVSIDDGHGGITTMTVSVAIAPANTAPTGTVTVKGGPNAATGAVDIGLTVNDDDGDGAVVTVSQSDKGGTVTYDAATKTFTYTPTAAARHTAAANGASTEDQTDTFTVTLDDGHGGITVQTVSVAILGANQGPTGSVTTGTPNPTTGTVNGTVTATDSDGDTATYSATGTSAKGGTVTIDAATGQFTYTASAAARHAAAANGASTADQTDTFTVTLDDGHGGITVQTVSVAIAPANTAPTGTVTANAPSGANGAVTGTVSVSDADGDTMTFTAPVRSVKGGTVSIDPVTGAFTYTPTAAVRHAASAVNASAADKSDLFTVTVDDGHGGTTTLTVSVNLSPANNAPTAVVVGTSFANGDFTTTLTGWTTLLQRIRMGVDSVGGWLTPTDPTNAPDGGVEASAISFGNYIANVVAGRAVLQSILSGVLNTPVGSGGVVHGPVIVSDDAVPIQAGAVVHFDWEASGGDDAYDVLGYIVDVNTGATHIILDATGSSAADVKPITGVDFIVPTAGVYKFVFVAGSWDATRGRAAGARLSIDNVTVTGNFVPNSTGVITGTVVGSDGDGDAVSYGSSGTSTKGGTVTIDAVTGAFVYTPSAAAQHAAAAAGATAADKVDTFIALVDDGHGGVTQVPVTVTITPANVAPTALASPGTPSASTGVVAGTVIATDGDGDATTFSGPATSVKGGTVTVDSATGAFTYTPTAAIRHLAAATNATAADLIDSFLVTVSDGHGGTSTVFVSLDIAPENTAPTGGFTAGSPGGSLGLVSGVVTGSDADGDTLAFGAPLTSTKGGTITIDAGTGAFTYVPTDQARQDASAAGATAADQADSFVATLDDGHGGVTAVVVTVPIGAIVGPAPPPQGCPQNCVGATVTFTGGTAYFSNGTTGTTSNRGLLQNVDYYVENGYVFDYIGGSGGDIGNYYGTGNDVIHGHWNNGDMTSIEIRKDGGGVFDFDYFVLTSNTDQPGGPASGNEKTYVQGFLNGVATGARVLLSPEDWGFPAVSVSMGSEFNGVDKVVFTSENPGFSCFGMDSFYIRTTQV